MDAGRCRNVVQPAKYIYIYIYIQGDQKVSFHLMIAIQKAGAQRLFDHPVVDSVENKKQFIGKLENLLIDQSFYSVNKFLNSSYEPQGNHYVQ